MKFVVPGELASMPEKRFFAFEELRLEIILQCRVLTPDTRASLRWHNAKDLTLRYQNFRWVFRVGSLAAVRELQSQAAEAQWTSDAATPAVFLRKLEQAVTRHDPAKYRRFQAAYRSVTAVQPGTEAPPGRSFAAFLENEKNASIQAKASTRLYHGGYLSEACQEAPLRRSQLPSLSAQAVDACLHLKNAHDRLLAQAGSGKLPWTPLAEYNQNRSQAAALARQRAADEALAHAASVLKGQEEVESWLV